MLDLDTLRFAQATVGICAFALVYFGTYLPLRAPYAGWWALVVAASAGSSVLYLLEGTPLQHGADAVGNALAVLSGAFAWAASRSLRRRSTRAWQIAALPLAVLVGSLFDVNAEGRIHGTPALLVGMALTFAMSARELWRLVRENAARVDEIVGDGTRAGVLAVAIASTCVATLYAVRVVSFVVVGPDSDFYVTWTGPLTTTIVVMLATVAVTYSVTELSRYELADRWRLLATRDDLTGLLTRGAFEERASAVLGSGRARAAVLVFADLDDFKALNDRRGHAAGDRVLRAFAQACVTALGPDDLVGRRGGDEFEVVIREADAARAVELTQRIREAMVAEVGAQIDRPTVSFGVAQIAPGETYEQAALRADEALYAAKRAGRDRAVIHGEEPAAEPDAVPGG